MTFLGLAWGGFGAYWLFFADPKASSADYRYLYGTVGVVVCVALLLLSFFVGRRHLWAWKTAAIGLAFGILLSLSDRLGLLDWAYLGLAVLALLMLLVARPGFENSPETEEEEPEET